MEEQAKTYKEILSVVELIKEKVKIEYLDTQCLVPDIIKICKDLNIKVYSGELDDDFEVAVWKDEETRALKIVIDKDCLDKGRYLVAKGLGAGLLGYADNNIIGFKKIDKIYNPASISSDIFATALLMDEDRIVNYLYESRGSIRELSIFFKVPIVCASKRMIYFDKTRYLK